MSTKSSSAEKDSQIDSQSKLARRYRHIAYALFGGLTLVLILFISYVVISSYQNESIRDPFTGEKVEAR